MEQWFGSATEIITAAAAGAVLFISATRSIGGKRSCGDLFYVLGPDSAVMAEHLEELARRGVIRPYQATAAG